MRGRKFRPERYVSEVGCTCRKESSDVSPLCSTPTTSTERSGRGMYDRNPHVEPNGRILLLIGTLRNPGPPPTRSPQSERRRVLGTKQRRSSSRMRCMLKKYNSCDCGQPPTASLASLLWLLTPSLVTAQSSSLLAVCRGEIAQEQAVRTSRLAQGPLRGESHEHTPLASSRIATSRQIRWG